jgi:hypothetical protein
MATRWPTITVVHTPVHASWLNQVEVYFSVVQRKALTPNVDDHLKTKESDHLADESPAIVIRV